MFENLFKGGATVKQMEGIDALYDATHYYGVDDVNQINYILATVYWETARTMQPIAEYGKGFGRKYGKRVMYNGTPYKDTLNIFYGRGFTQNTWYDNYKKLSGIFKVDLIQNPDLLVTDIKLSARVSVYSMQKGLYTGKKLSDYINENKVDFINARRIINLLDKAAVIASYAEKFSTG